VTKPASKDIEVAEGHGRLVAAYRGKSIEVSYKSFSLMIRADDGSTLLETHVDYMHQAFQRLIDWSINETCQDVCAVITGPNGFYKKHRIKASREINFSA
jgi:hypothetical protein